MSSLSRLQANKANAQKSTGPTSSQGKARSAQNARKHGLRTKITSDPDYRVKILSLRKCLLKENANRSTAIDPLGIAMMEVDRIAKTRGKHLHDSLASGEAMDLVALLDTLETLERYDRRAHFRLHRSIEAYAPAPGPKPSRKHHVPKLSLTSRPALQMTFGRHHRSGF